MKPIPRLVVKDQFEQVGCPSPSVNFAAFQAWHEGYRAGVAAMASEAKKVFRNEQEEANDRASKD